VERLDSLYGKLLHFGFISIREALRSQDYERAEAEMELLHNVPSLLGELNVKRHQYFWLSEREHYIRWAKARGSERSQAVMRMFYEPVWLEMGPILEELFSIKDSLAAAKSG
jgi:hypothetical protein